MYSKSFNPRPTGRPGATHTSTDQHLVTLAFQPSPDRKAGRDLGGSGGAGGVEGFNPRPTGRPGATAGRGPAGPPGEVSTLARPEGRARPTLSIESRCRAAVSTLARPEGRARRFRRSAIASPRSSFNPRPTGRPGATAQVRPTEAQDRVSTLARPEGRARPAPHARGALALSVSTLARPEGRARPSRVIEVGSYDVFQPSPDRKAGRDARASALARRCTCFNPRPTGRPGVTLNTYLRDNLRYLFQPTPDRKVGRDIWPPVPCSAGASFNPRPSGRPGATSEARSDSPVGCVSILTRPEGRARRRRPAVRHPSLRGCFNPRPTGRPGATQPPELGLLVGLVSTHARAEGRARPAAAAWVLLVPSFQPTPDRKAGRD